MTRAFFLIPIILVCACYPNSSKPDLLSNSSTVDSTTIVYNSAFKMCSLRVETVEAEIAGIIPRFIHKDSIKADSLQKITDNCAAQYRNSVDDFVSMTNFGHRNGWELESYANFLRIQYLETHLPPQYFAYHKNKILSIANDTVIFSEWFKNTSDTTQQFLLQSTTLKVLHELEVDSNLVPYNTLKNINILVQSFGDFIDSDFFPCFIQNKPYNCGPACLKMITDYYNEYHSITEIEKLAETDTSGTSFSQLEVAASKMGFNALYVNIGFEKLCQLKLPIIVHWNDNHFVVLYSLASDTAKIADPYDGIRHISYEEFCDHWLFNDGKAVSRGNVLVITPEDDQLLSISTTSRIRATWKPIYSGVAH